MSENVRDIAVDVLTPLVGKAMATVYFSAAVLTAADEGSISGAVDVDALCEAIRDKISPFASRAVVDQAVSDIRARAGR